MWQETLDSPLPTGLVLPAFFCLAGSQVYSLPVEDEKRLPLPTLQCPEFLYFLFPSIPAVTKLVHDSLSTSVT